MKKKILKGIGILILLVVIFIGFIIYNTSAQYKKLSQGDLISNIAVDTIPYIYSSTGHILLNVKINGSKDEYPFMLDSGASNFIFNKFQNENELKKNGYAIGRNSSGKIFFSKIKKIDSLQINNLSFINLNAKEVELNFDCSEDIYGIIGIGIMRHLIWKIDFKNQIIIVSNKLDNFKFKENKIEIPLSENKFSHHISTSIKFRSQNRTTKVLVDLGNNGTLSLRENEVLKDSINFISKKIYGIGSSGLKDDSKRKSNEKIYLLDSIIFGNTNYSVKNLTAITNPTGLNLLGLGFLKNYITTISWSDKLIILEPYDNTLNFVKKSFGFSTKYNKETSKIIINSIIEDTPASNSKLLLNAEIISINNMDVTDLSSYCLYKSEEFSKDSIKLKVKESGLYKEYQFKKEPIFN
jgi:hypothetical protein